MDFQIFNFKRPREEWEYVLRRSTSSKIQAGIPVKHAHGNLQDRLFHMADMHRL